MNEPKRIIVALSPRALPSEYTVTVRRLPLPEFRDDHGQACCCMRCVVLRGERRIAEDKRLRP